MPNYKLSILLTSRDRTILTKKTIDSLYENSTVFEELDIYVFDNLSELSNERYKLFLNMLNNKTIKYYSYDTETSIINCFGKAIAFKRWTTMMRDEHQVRIKKDGRNLKNETRYYLLIDNDMLVGQGWDEYFISAITQIPKEEEHIHYLVQWPGGIPSGSRQQSRKHPVINAFSGEQFSLGVAGFGGGSGFWFMTYDMLQSMEWNIDDLTMTYKHYKKHDTTTWTKIRRKLGANEMAKYVCGIILPKNADPIVLHLGGQFGSICNSETRVDKNYENDKLEFELKEKEIKKLSVNEIFQKYKTKCNIW